MLRERGLPGRPGQLQPGHDHDRPRVRRPHLHRAARPSRSSTAIIERERPDALLPTLGGQTALNLAMALVRGGRARALRGRADRGRRHRHRHRRGPRAVQGGHDRDRPGRPRLRASPTPSTRRSRSASASACPIIVRPVLHPGRAAAPASPGPRRASPGAAAIGLAASPISEILIERVDRRLEGVRARGHARPGRQLRGRLLDRELRPDGRPHRRLDHRRPGPDPLRRRVPADARRRVRLHPPDRGGDRRLQHPVRRQPGQRRHGRHRDEPPGQPLVGAWPPRPPGSRSPRSRPAWPSATPSTRSPTTSPGETPASFEPTIDYVVTKIPRWAFEKFPGIPDVLGHPDAVGRRGHGHRPHVPRVVAEGAALARARPARPQLRPRRGALRRAETTTSWCRRAAIGHPRPALPSRGGAAPGHRVERLYAATGVDPWFLDQIWPDRRRARTAWPFWAGPAWPLTAAGWRRAKRLGFSDAQLA